MRCVLLDMGGVLVELCGERPFLEMIGDGVGADEMWRRWLHSPSVRAHETGRMDTPTFAEEAVREFGLSVGPEEFLEHFRGWLAGPFAGAHELLDELAARHRTAILTNISAVHWPIAESYGLFDRVERVFASYRMGAIKPDRDYFETVLAELGRRAVAGRLLRRQRGERGGSARLRARGARGARRGRDAKPPSRPRPARLKR